jgi:V8-like Glu-specific endopeptidase
VHGPINRIARRSSPLAIIAVAFAVAWAPNASANPTTVVSHAVAQSPAKVNRVNAYWTARRMQHAEPRMVARPRGQVKSSHTGAATPDGPPVAIPPSLPKGYAGLAAGDAPTRLSQLIPNPAAYPYRTQGKLFFQALDRGVWNNYVCSATVVDTPTKRVIFTAGHCEHDAGSWSRRVAFVPGYQNGNRPFGTFVATKLYSTSGWIQSENFSYDISAAVLGGSRPVANVVGSRGIIWNQPRQQAFVSFGYPAGYPYNGQTLRSCPSPLGGIDSSTYSPQTQWITCDMTGGSSGGGWIIQGTYLNSVNSYGYAGLRNRMYGPYFGNAVASLYNTVKNQTP